MFQLLSRHNSIWKSVAKGPADGAFGILDVFQKDKNARKVNLGIGVYKGEDGKPFVLPSVLKAKALIYQSPDHEYLPIDGLASFTSLATQLAYSNSPSLLEKRIASIQSLSGTGALRVGLAFVKRFYPHAKKIYISKPTWSLHKDIASHCSLEIQEHAYYDPDIKGLGFEHFMDDIDSAPKNSVFVLQASGHNPTGVDPTPEQWKQIQDLMATKQHLCLFDLAYQGFVTGNADADAFPVRLFANQENPMIVMQSFSKNFGLYGERIGNLSVVCDSAIEAERVLSQLKIIARAMYSNPPIFGSRIVSTILGNADLKQQWLTDVKGMADRLLSMRKALVDRLKAKGSPHDWSHIEKQTGIFAYTGLHPDHCEELIDKHHVYLSLEGRISLAGLNQRNIDYVAEAIETVTRFTPKL